MQLQDKLRVIANAFCPTGPGGGQDNSCSPNSKAVTKTPEFKKWFGNSKVVDEHGEPLVVYHGTDKDFDEFKPRSKDRPDLWFTSDPVEAGVFADNPRGNIKPVFLAVQNPAPAGSSLSQAIKHGHDGVIEEHGGRKVIVVFSPTQIKSATGNRGTFDPEDPIITHSAIDNAFCATGQGGGVDPSCSSKQRVDKFGHPVDKDRDKKDAIARKEHQKRWDDYKSRHKFLFTASEVHDPEKWREALSAAAEKVEVTPGWHLQHDSVVGSVYFKHNSGKTLRISDHDPAYAKQSANIHIRPSKTPWLVGDGAESRLRDLLTVNRHSANGNGHVHSGNGQVHNAAKKKTARRTFGTKPIARKISKKKSPTRMDPTRLATLRRVWAADLKRRFASISRALYQLLVRDDAFGLDNPDRVFNYNPDQARDEQGRWAGSSPTLMHGTSYTSAKQILKEGFKPGEGGRVFATPNKQIAIEYGWSHAGEGGVERPDDKFAVVVLKNSTAGFRIDNPSSATDTWQWSKIGVVPPEDILRVEVYSAWHKDAPPIEVLTNNSQDKELFAVAFLNPSRVFNAKQLDPSYSPEHPEECCPHCGARLERGDDGSCNRCGEPRPVENTYDVAKEVERAARETDRIPSDAARAAGNYRKGRVWVQGLEVAIESPRGSIRQGVGPDGKPWSVKLRDHYGYIIRVRSKGTENGSNNPHQTGGRTQDEIIPGVPFLEGNEVPVFEPESPSLSSVRGSRDYDISSMGKQFCIVSNRYGATPEGDQLRTEEKQRRVQPDKLLLGNPDPTKSESEVKPFSDLEGGNKNFGGMVGRNRSTPEVDPTEDTVRVDSGKYNDCGEKNAGKLLPDVDLPRDNPQCDGVGEKTGNPREPYFQTTENGLGGRKSTEQRDIRPFGADDQKIDCFLGPDPTSEKVFVIDQTRSCIIDNAFCPTGPGGGQDNSCSSKQGSAWRIFWHGSPSGELHGGPQGLHIGTKKAAMQALEARIGVPAEGEWDGTREYGKTKLMGQARLRELEKQGIYKNTGYNAGSQGKDMPEEDYYPDGTADYADGSIVPLTVKPDIFPVRIVGQMGNTPGRPRSDDKANRDMYKELKKGTPAKGYFYREVGEDEGSIAAVLPSGTYIEKIDRTKVHNSACREFDEHKCMIGWDIEAEAKQAYHDNFSEGWDGFAGITEMTMPQFKQWLREGDSSKPIAEQKMPWEETLNDKLQLLANAFCPTGPGGGQDNSCSPSSRAVTQTPEFKEWFGDSKVVDDKGQPLVVYHGTDQEGLTEFYGGWWSEDKQVTKEFGSQRYEAYLKMENPAYDEDIRREYETFNGEPLNEESEESRGTNLRDEAISGGPFSRYLRGKGYDGIITWDDSNAREGNAYVVFDPTQVKSASGNRGTFDKHDPIITHSAMTLGQKLRLLAADRSVLVFNSASDDEDIRWITVRGQHIPIREGEDVGKAIKERFKQVGKGDRSLEKKPTTEPAEKKTVEKKEVVEKKEPAEKKTTGKFDRDAWASKPMAERRAEWEKMSVSQRDEQADAGRSVKSRVGEILKGVGDRPDSGDLKKDLESRLEQLSDRVHPQAVDRMRTVSRDYQNLMQEAGVKPVHQRAMAMEALDYLAAQESEAMGRSLGDHGIAHIKGNIDTAMQTLEAVPGQDTAKDKLAAYTACIYHDTGYLTEPSRGFLDEGHPRWSEEHYNANVRPLVTQALGSRAADEISHVIRTHDATDMNWHSDPVASSVRLADNLAVFHTEKLPPVFRYVKGNVDVLKQLGAGKIDRDEAQGLLLNNIDKSDLTDHVKGQLRQGAKEVSAYTPKVTLGMLGGRLTGVRWKDGMVVAEVTESRKATELNRLGDFGQSQFRKLAKTYGADPDQFQKDLNHTFKDKAGRAKLRIEMKRATENMLLKLHLLAGNAFCPTGKGGGQDNSCSPGKTGYMDVGHNRPAKLWYYSTKTGRLSTADNQIEEEDEDTGEPTGKIRMTTHEEVWPNAFGGPPTDDIYGRYDPETKELTAVTGSGFLNSVPKHVLAELKTKFPDMKFVPTDNVLTNAGERFMFQTSPEQVDSFRKWLTQLLKQYLLDEGVSAEDQWFEQYMEEGFRKGAMRAFDDSRPAVKKWMQSEEANEKLDFYDGTREDFLRSSFARPVSVEKVKLLAGRTFTDLKGISDQMAAKLTRGLTDGLVQGKNSKQMYKELAKEVGISETRARMIAQTECLPADTRVSTAVVRAVFRRWYDGDMIEIKTRNGRKFSATLNHPMLTRKGWVAAGLLSKGDDLVCDGRKQDMIAGDPNGQNAPPTIREIFDSLYAVGVVERKLTVPLDFHGDGMDGNVDVLCPNGELRIGNFASVLQPLAQDVFSSTNGAALSFCPVCGRLLPINKRLCFCQSPQFDTLLPQPLLDNTATNPKSSANLGRSFTSCIEGDNLINGKSVDELITNPAHLPGVELGFGNRPGCIEFFEDSGNAVLPLAQLNSNLLCCEPRGVQAKDLSLLSLGEVGGLNLAQLDGTEQSLGVVTNDPSLFQHPSDGASSNPDLFGDITNGESLEVEIDCVEFVKHYSFCGHVYNLETPFGYFTIDQLYTGNTTRAHAEGQLQAFDLLGVTKLGVMAEWATAEDDRVCDACDSLDSVVMTVDEARGLLPRHPGCRCAWTPANVGEDEEDQIRGKKAIEDAIDESVEDSGGADKTTWPGADTVISKKRPEGIFNAQQVENQQTLMINQQATIIDRLDNVVDLLNNVFCPTGKGGGVDPSCSLSADRSLLLDDLKVSSSNEARDWVVKASLGDLAERAVIVDSEDKVVHQSKGGGFGVQEATNFINRKGLDPRSMTVIHNHPGGHGLSRGDVLMLKKSPALSKIEAITHPPHGDGMRYIAGPGPKMSSVSDKNLASAYDRAYASEREKLLRKRDRGLLKQRDVDYRADHMACVALAKRGYITYESIEGPISNVFCPTGEGGGVDPSCKADGQLAGSTHQRSNTGAELKSELARLSGYEKDFAVHYPEESSRKMPAFIQERAEEIKSELAFREQWQERQKTHPDEVADLTGVYRVDADQVRDHSNTFAVKVGDVEYHVGRGVGWYPIEKGSEDDFGIHSVDMDGKIVVGPRKYLGKDAGEVPELHAEIQRQYKDALNVDAGDFSKTTNDYGGGDLRRVLSGYKSPSTGSVYAGHLNNLTEAYLSHSAVVGLSKEDPIQQSITDARERFGDDWEARLREKLPSVAEAMSRSGQTKTMLRVIDDSRHQGSLLGQGTVNEFAASVKATQEDLAKRYPEGHLTLYRGVQGDYAKAIKQGLKSKKEEVEIAVNPASSYTQDRSIAQTFAGKRGVVIKQQVPIHDVLFSWESSDALSARDYVFGGTEEQEVLVASRTGKMKLSKKDVL